MISWADAHARAAATAAELHADLGIDLDPAGRRLRRRSSGSGSCSRSRRSAACRASTSRAADGRSGIMLHSGHPRTRQRYTAGHELGHHVFDHAAEDDLDIEHALRRGNVDRWPDHEKEAEAFSAWFLMPRRLDPPRPRRARHRQAARSARRLRAVAVARHQLHRHRPQLAAVRIVDQATADRWARVEPRALKQALAGELVPDDMRNDVWWLDARHHRQPVEARPGDRLVITLRREPQLGLLVALRRLPADVRLLADSYEDDWEPQLTLEQTDQRRRRTRRRRQPAASCSRSLPTPSAASTPRPGQGPALGARLAERTSIELLLSRSTLAPRPPGPRGRTRPAAAPDDAMIDPRPPQTPVRNQGDRPTCVAFATSAAHEWAAGEPVHRSPEDAMWAGPPGRGCPRARGGHRRLGAEWTAHPRPRQRGRLALRRPALDQGPPAAAPTGEPAGDPPLAPARAAWLRGRTRCPRRRRAGNPHPRGRVLAWRQPAAGHRCRAGPQDARQPRRPRRRHHRCGETRSHHQELLGPGWGDRRLRLHHAAATSTTTRCARTPWRRHDRDPPTATLRPDLSDGWLGRVRLLGDHPGHKAVHVVVRIADPTIEDPPSAPPPRS